MYCHRVQPINGLYTAGASAHLQLVLCNQFYFLLFFTAESLLATPNSQLLPADVNASLPLPPSHCLTLPFLSQSPSVSHTAFLPLPLLPFFSRTACLSA